jgi:lysophospholipase L1-like esterase
MNTAIIPARNVQLDFYDWDERHQQKQAQAQSDKHDLVFIGDSITHMFEVEDRGLPVWERYYGHRRALDLGYGWDCTQNVLWRLENGEFAGQQPKLVVLNIGTNNLTGNDACPANTAEEIVEGIAAICGLIQQKSPQTTILSMAIFPRSLTSDPVHAKAKLVNTLLARHLRRKPGILHLNIGERFLGPDGEIPCELMDDRCHPTKQGYGIWAEAIEPVVRHYL